MRSTTDRSYSDLTLRLETIGLTILGFFGIDGDEILIPDRPIQPSSVAIVGNVGSAIWPVFDQARQSHPDLTLDHWTKDIIDNIASTFDVEALYPFEGPPYHPFTRWALRTKSLFPSPLGLTIHPTFGLWHAFRAALLFDDRQDQPGLEAENPCESCKDKPCLDACPVGAFSTEGYDFEVCLGHVATPSNACRQGGCLARVACPIGQDFRYEADHAAFHMSQLLRAHGRG